MSDLENRSSEEPLRARANARATDGTVEDDTHASARVDDSLDPSAGGDAGVDERAADPAAARGPAGTEPRDGDGAGPARSPDTGAATEVEEDIDELVALTAQRDEYLSLAQRTQADFENYKKRVAREAAQALGRGVCKLAKELLPALDSLDRAIGAAESQDPLLEGVRLVRAELQAALTRAGVESFSPLGEVFDPSLHEAVATAEQPENGAASGTVAEVFQDGYRLGETIIRPARVVVAA